MGSARATFDKFGHPALPPCTPVLSRGPGEVQVGFDQDPALVLSDVSAGTPRLIRLFDGGHSLAELRTWSVRLDTGMAQLDWILSTLDQAGLLHDGYQTRAPTPTEAARVRLIGAGVLGGPVARLLVRSGVGVLHVIDNDPPDPALYRTSGTPGSQAEALVARLTDQGRTQVRVANHWSKPEVTEPDLTIVASDRLECDRVVVEGLVRADQPHLVVRARTGGVLVGPLVVPGTTACVRCTDLSRRDTDPAWPILLPQLTRIRYPVEAALSAWAGAVATAQALAFLQGTAPETCGATIEISPTDYRTRWRPWPMHPACGCGWGATAQ